MSLTRIFDLQMNSLVDSGPNSLAVTEVLPPWAYYKLDDNTATSVVVDESGNYDGNLSSGTSADVSTTDAWINRAFNLPGTKYINLGNVLNPDDKSISIGMSIKTAASDVTEMFFCKRDTSGTGAHIRAWTRTSDPYIRMEIRDNSNNIVSTGSGVSSIRDGSRHYVVFVWNWWTKEIKIYVDGSIVNTTDASAITDDITNTANFYLGCDRNNGNVFTGIMDEVRIFHWALDQKDIDFLWNSGNGTTSQISNIRTDGPLGGYWFCRGGADHRLEIAHSSLMTATSEKTLLIDFARVGRDSNHYYIASKFGLGANKEKSYLIYDGDVTFGTQMTDTAGVNLTSRKTSYYTPQQIRSFRNYQIAHIWHGGTKNLLQIAVDGRLQEQRANIELDPSLCDSAQAFCLGASTVSGITIGGASGYFSRATLFEGAATPKQLFDRAWGTNLQRIPA